MTENEFLLEDRLGVIRDTITKYGEDKFYLSFSGGKDSTVVHHLLDMALPDNKIPRVFSNTGMEYKAISEFVQSRNDERIVIIPPTKNIPQTLQKVGYPFKSKLYSEHYSIYRRNKDAIHRELERIKENPKLLESYDYIHNLPKGVKTVIKYMFNIRERERERVENFINFMGFPEKLRYQWYEDFNISDKCCTEFKEKPMDKWSRGNHKPIVITGMMKEEGGRRGSTKCIGHFRGRTTFNPLAIVSIEWENWFIQEHHIELCKLYYPPYNYERTGCRGCPFNVNLQDDLNKMSPSERKACETVFKPVYDEYRRIGYRLKKEEQLKLL